MVNAEYGDMHVVLDRLSLTKGLNRQIYICEYIDRDYCLQKLGYPQMCDDPRCLVLFWCERAGKATGSWGFAVGAVSCHLPINKCLIPGKSQTIVPEPALKSFLGLIKVIRARLEISCQHVLYRTM